MQYRFSRPSQSVQLLYSFIPREPQVGTWPPDLHLPFGGRWESSCQRTRRPSTESLELAQLSLFVSRANPVIGKYVIQI
jgi:hypothetical protein